MKIMHFIHGLNTGGAETLVKNYVLNFDRKKNDIVLLCLRHITGTPYERLLKDAGIRVIYVDDYLIVKGGAGFFIGTMEKLNRYLVVRNIIKKESPDILHTHLTLNRFVKFARPKRGTVIIHTVHSEPRELWMCDANGRKDYLAAKWLVTHRGMRFIVLHSEMAEEISRMFGRPGIYILNNGIDMDKFKCFYNKVEVRREIGIPEDTLVIGHIGRFSSTKNHSFLVDIFAEIVRKRSAFLLMIGDGPEKEEIVEKLKSKGLEKCYKILSNRDDIPHLLGAMDVFVFPSHYEGVPISAIEAQAARLPCFFSDVINQRVDISNLVKRLSLKQDAKEWAEEICNYEIPKQIVINDKNWDIKSITHELENIYLKILTKNRRDT